MAAGSADSARFDVFQLGEAVRAADAARALRILGGLQAEGAEPPLVLWALLRELRALQSGERARAPVARLIARAARADRLAKGLQDGGDAWDELMLLAVELTGVRTLPLLRVRQEPVCPRQVASGHARWRNPSACSAARSIRFTTATCAPRSSSGNR